MQPRLVGSLSPHRRSSTFTTCLSHETDLAVRRQTENTVKSRRRLCCVAVLTSSIGSKHISDSKKRLISATSESKAMRMSMTVYHIIPPSDSPWARGESEAACCSRMICSSSAATLASHSCMRVCCSSRASCIARMSPSAGVELSSKKSPTYVSTLLEVQDLKLELGCEGDGALAWSRSRASCSWR